MDEYFTDFLQSDLNIQEEYSDTDIIADHGDISIGGNSLGISASTPFYLTFGGILYLQHPFISLMDEYFTFFLQSDLNIQEEDSDTDIIADHGDISIGGYSLGTSASTPFYLTFGGILYLQHPFISLMDEYFTFFFTV